MPRPEKSGKIFESGRVSAGKIAAALGLSGPEPETKAPPLSPNQERERLAGKTPKPLVSDAEVQVTVIEGGRDVWEHFGRPDVSSPPPGSPDGTPVGPEFTPREEEEDDNDPNANWSQIDANAAAAEKARGLRRELREVKEKVGDLLVREGQAEQAHAAEEGEALAEEIADGRRRIAELRERTGI